MSVQQEIAANVPAMSHINGNHVELFATFSSGGTNVNVALPSFTMTKGGSPVSIPAANLLIPFTKNGPGTGQYHICFLGDTWLDNGTYSISMTGYTPVSGGTGGSQVAITGEFVVRAANSIQNYIEALRSALNDIAPGLYVIDDPTAWQWKDGQLYDALNRSLNAINMTKPSRYTWGLTGCPWPSLLIDGAVIYALHSKALIEVANTFSYNDEISFAIDRSQKYQNLAQMLYQNWVTERGRVKQDYAFMRAFPIGMGSTRLPYSVARVFSFSRVLTNTLGGIDMQSWY